MDQDKHTYYDYLGQKRVEERLEMVLKVLGNLSTDIQHLMEVIYAYKKEGEEEDNYTKDQN